MRCSKMQFHSRRRLCAALTVIALCALIPSSIAASDRPVAPREIQIRPAAAFALGDWFVDSAGRTVCQTPGSRCLMIYAGPVQIVIPISSPLIP